MPQTYPYLIFSNDNPSRTYITPLITKGEEDKTKSLLADIIEEGDYMTAHVETKQLTPGEVAQQLVDNPIARYVIINKNTANKLIEHREKGFENYGEEYFLMDEYHDVILDAYNSTSLFTEVPTLEAIEHLTNLNN